jgi:hypothetical protein
MVLSTLSTTVPSTTAVWTIRRATHSPTPQCVRSGAAMADTGRNRRRRTNRNTPHASLRATRRTPYEALEESPSRTHTRFVGRTRRGGPVYDELVDLLYKHSR